MTTIIPPLSLTPLHNVLIEDPRRLIKKYSVLSYTESFFMPPSLSDFSLQEEPATDLQEEDGIARILHDPHNTLYCYDFPSRRAIFVQCNSDNAINNLYSYPFLVLAQQKYATHLFSVPLEQLEKALLVPPQDTPSNDFVFNHNNTGLKSIDQVLFLFNTGRCGSTLLCKVLSQIEGVLGLQEPEPFISLNLLRHSGAPESEITTLLRLTVLAHCKPAYLHIDRVHKWVFKFRGSVAEYMELFPRAFPKSQHLFMYRNGEAVTKSFAGLVSSLESDLSVFTETWTALTPGLKWIPGEKKYARDIVAVYWLSAMFRALQCKQSGIKMPCVRYEELIAQPEKVIVEIARIYNIDLKDCLPAALKAMHSHSQEGVVTIHPHQQLDGVLQQMRDLVTANEEIGSVHFIMPDTILL